MLSTQITKSRIQPRAILDTMSILRTTSAGFFIGDIMKKCIKCDETKELSKFPLRLDSTDSYRNQCKKCRSNYLKEYVSKNRTSIQAYRKEYRRKSIEVIHAYNEKYFKTEHYKDLKKQASRRYCMKYPIRSLAVNTLNNAVRDKRLKKPDKCSECGRKCRIHGHHEDYYKPLDVIWLCQVCHIKRHKEVNYDIRINESSRPDQCQNQEA